MKLFSRKTFLWIRRKFLIFSGVVLSLFIILAIVINVTDTADQPFWSTKYPIEGIELAAPGVPAQTMTVPGSNPPKPYYKNLRIIEFDEYGDFWDSKQLREATNLIGKVDNNPAGTPLIVFVHGWRHDADAKPRSYGNDLIRFNNFLEKYEQSRHSTESGTAKHGAPVGIFIGWRGRSITTPGLEYLSFPPRRIATNRISASTAFSRCIWDIRRYANRNRFKTRVILIGHSLGGRILERVASPPIINYANAAFRDSAHPNEKRIWNAAVEELITTNPDFDLTVIPSLQVCDDYINDRKSGVLEPTALEDLRTDLREQGILTEGINHGIDLCLNGLDYRNRYLPADLVLLINPASEAIQARQLKLATITWPWNEPPAMISLTSETDVVTGGILPLGKRLEKIVFPTVPMTENRYNLGKLGHEFQSGYVEHTCGHDRRIVSGFVNRNKEIQPYPRIFESLIDTHLFDGVHYQSFDRIAEANLQLNKDKVRLEKMEIKIDSSTEVKDGYRYAPENRTIYIDPSCIPEADETLTDPTELCIKGLSNCLHTDPNTASNQYLCHKLPVGGYLVLRVDREILTGHGGKRDDNGIFNARMQEVCINLLRDTERANFRTSDLEKFIWEVDHDYKKGSEAERENFLNPVENLVVEE